jgi:twinkle protein
MIISEETITAIKNKAILEDVVQDFVVLSKKGVNLVGLCPYQHKEKTPSFYVSPSRQICKCFGCGKGNSDAIGFLMDSQGMSYPQALTHLAGKYNIPVDEESKVFVKPEWKNKTTLPEPIVKWFEGRKIRQKTLSDMKISFDKVYMPSVEKELPAVQFNYFMDGELINIKSRSQSKDFALVPKAKLILYNIDSIKGKKEVYIVEGEPDCLSLIEAGYVNETSGVVSVPNGAGAKGNNLSYIDNCIHLFEGVEKIYIGTDNDIAGRRLREELAERFGKDRCSYLEWKDKKDANDVLIQYGIEGIHDCCSHPINFPITGTFTISDFSYEIDDMYVNGLDKGVSIGLRDFWLRFVPGYITVVTGISNDGKSDFVDEICMRLLTKHQWKGAYYSPENKPTQLHFSKLARKLTGKNWDGDNRITREEVTEVKNYLEKKVFFIQPEKDFSIQNILNTVMELKKEYGIKWFVIDAWNKLEHKGGSDLAYIGKTLDDLAIFCTSIQVHCFLVAHPRKMDKDKKTKLRDVPSLYDISGSADFFNKCDNGITVYVDWSTKISQIHRQKVKFSHWGFKGMSEYKYDLESSRYYKEAFPEKTNWITGKPIEIPKTEAEELFDVSDIIVADNTEDDSPF